MATTLTGTTTYTTDLTYRNTDDTLGTVTKPLAYSRSESWASTEADTLWSRRVEIEHTTYPLDLYGGLTDDFGDAINLATLREIVIINRATTAGHIVKIYGDMIRNASSGIIDGWVNDAISLIAQPMGGWRIWAKDYGITVTENTMEDLTLDSGANDIWVDIILLGKA